MQETGVATIFHCLMEDVDCIVYVYVHMCREIGLEAGSGEVEQG